MSILKKVGENLNTKLRRVILFLLIYLKEKDILIIIMIN